MSELFQLAAVSAFAAGALGGVHCAGMCGGLVGACAAGARAERRLAILVGANLGRIASYTFAGALVGAIGQAGLLLRGGALFQQIMFLIASLMMIALGAYLAGHGGLLRPVEAAGAALWRRVEPGLGWVLPVNTVPRAVGFGALWGWMPCGLVYAMLATALAMSSTWQGALVMAAFGAGTLPNLVAVGWLAGRASGAARRLRVPAGIAVAAFGVYGLYKMTQPAIFGEDGLLCHAWPALTDWLR